MYESYAWSNIQVFTDSPLETIIMILVKQEMWIIRFEYDKGSFQRYKSLLYELNLKNLHFDQSQDATKVEIPIYKDI